MSPLEALQKLPAKPVSVILDQLVAIQLAFKDDPEVARPLITLMLRNGQSQTGYVVARELDEKYGDFLLLHLPGSDMPHADAMYVPTAVIDAVIVRDIGPVAHSLSFGAIGTPLGAKAPTRLELRSKVDQLSKDVSAEVGASIVLEVKFEGIAESPDSASALLQSAKDTASVLKELAKDPIGKSAIAQGVQKVQFVEGPKGVTRQGGVLSVTGAWSKGPADRLNRDALRSAISKVL